MEPIAAARWGRRIALAAGSVGLAVSFLALYVKLYFWGGMRYAPLYVIAASWYLIAAGPLALWLSTRRYFASLAVTAMQLALIALASI